METLKDILWPIIFVGGLGAFIDFLIGKTGQERAKDFLLRWWVRFDDVRWRNFGREEGLFVGRLIEQCFGRRIWSGRRIAIAFAILVFLIFIGYLRLALSSLRFFDPSFCYWCHLPLYVGGTALIASFAAFCIGVSFTILIAFRMAYLCGVGKFKNLFVFIVMLVVNYLILLYWSPITAVMRGTLLFAVRENVLTTEGLLNAIEDVIIDSIMRSYKVTTAYSIMPIQIIKEEVPMDGFAFILLPLLASLFRIVLSIVFVGSFLLRPFAMRPVSLVWARIVESEKPVFTLTFGGAAAFATAVIEVAKHL